MSTLHSAPACHACHSATYRESAEVGMNDYFHYSCCTNRDCAWSIARTHFDYSLGKIDLEGNEIRVRSYNGKPERESEAWPSQEAVAYVVKEDWSLSND